MTHNARYCAHCVDGTAHEPDAPLPPWCESCALAPMIRGTDQCAACLISYCLHVDPAEMDSLRRAFRDEPELAELEAEWARQSAAVAHVPNLRVRQAS